MEFIKRLISAIVIFLVTMSVMYYNEPFFILFLIVIGAMLSWEWEQMFMKQTSGFAVALAAMSAITVFLTSMSYLLLSLLLILLAYAVFYFYIRKSRKVVSPYFAFGILYINLPLMSLSLISSFFAVSELHDMATFLILLWLFLTVWASDTGGYIFGKLLRGPKLAPKISPNKTWSGFFGGILLAVLCSFVYIKVVPHLPNIMSGYGYGYVTDDPKHIYRYFLLFTVIVSVVSQIGDLFESWIKRKLEIKDSSNIIPGHGGIFDRFDGLLFASFFVAVTLFIHWVRLVGVL